MVGFFWLLSEEMRVVGFIWGGVGKGNGGGGVGRGRGRVWWLGGGREGGGFAREGDIGGGG